MKRKAPKFLRTLGADIGLLLASSVVAILLLEVSLRWIFPSVVDSPYHCVWPPGLHAVFRPDPEIVPGISGESAFITNSRGIRGDEMPGEDAYAILAIGGSTTENLFLDQSEAWPYILQQRLNAAARGPRVWVGNVGKSGLTTRDHIIQLQHLLPELPRIDAIVFLVGVNDLGLKNQQESTYDPHFLSRPGAEGELLPRAFAVYPLGSDVLPWHRRLAIWQLARNVKRRLLAAGRDYQDQSGGVIGRWRSERRNAIRIRETMPDLTEALGEYARNIERMIEVVREHGGRPVFLTQPTIWRPDLPPDARERLWVGKIGEGAGAHEYYSVEVLAAEMERYNETLQATCRERGVECFDLASLLPKDTSVFYDDDHFTEEGSRMVADHLTRYLLERPPYQKETSGP